MVRPVEFFLVLCAGASPFPAGNGEGGKNGQKSAKLRKSSLIVREPPPRGGFQFGRLEFASRKKKTKKKTNHKTKKNPPIKKKKPPKKTTKKRGKRRKGKKNKENEGKITSRGNGRWSKVPPLPPPPPALPPPLGSGALACWF